MGAVSVMLIGAIVLYAQRSGKKPSARVIALAQMPLRGPGLTLASTLVSQYQRISANSPAALEASSWIARRELAQGQFEEAYKDAQETQRRCETLLQNRKLDSDPRLATALGAAYEVQAQVLTQTGRKSDATALLRTALSRWRGTSITARLQKNLNLLTFEGKPMPPLDDSEWIGAKPPLQSALRGKVVLLFFWAHWCPDCKADAPILAQLANELGPKGLLVIGPTERYGYTAQNEHASPDEEKAFIEAVYARFYSEIPNMSVPISSKNFDRYGASTTPTFVLVDRHGIVRLYHPGYMDESALRAAIDPLLSAFGAKG